MSLFKVLSTSKKNASAFIVESRHRTKGKAKRAAKKIRGYYWGSGPGSVHRKVACTYKGLAKKYKRKGGDLYHVFAHVRRGK